MDLYLTHHRSCMKDLWCCFKEGDDAIQKACNMLTYPDTKMMPSKEVDSLKAFVEMAKPDLKYDNDFDKQSISKMRDALCIICQEDLWAIYGSRPIRREDVLHGVKGMGWIWVRE